MSEQKKPETLSQVYPVHEKDIEVLGGNSSLRTIKVKLPHEATSFLLSTKYTLLVVFMKKGD